MIPQAVLYTLAALGASWIGVFVFFTIHRWRAETKAEKEAAPPAGVPMNVARWLVLCRSLTWAVGHLEGKGDNAQQKVFADALKWAERYGVSVLARRDHLLHDDAIERFREMLEE